jgi:cell cycle checkpoint protein
MANYINITQCNLTFTLFLQVDELKCARYRFSLLKHGLKPIAMSEKVSIRIDHRDFLCLQYMIKFNEGTCFVEFYCAPEEEDHFLPT